MGSLTIFMTERVGSPSGHAYLYDCGADLVCGDDDVLLYRYVVADLTFGANDPTISLNFTSYNGTSHLGEGYGRWKFVIPAGNIEDEQANPTDFDIEVEFIKDPSNFDFAMVMSADHVNSNEETLTFKAQFGDDVPPGIYNLCYCNDQLDETLEVMGSGQTTYKLTEDIKVSAVLVIQNL